ncbi:MAG: hypothetical protein CMJ78_16140 [Planctomycetaceae bacterium]|nr:hypothetical protein [Planctomycetaceae bacterium]
MNERTLVEKPTVSFARSSFVNTKVSLLGDEAVVIEQFQADQSVLAMMILTASDFAAFIIDSPNSFAVNCEIVVFDECSAGIPLATDHFIVQVNGVRFGFENS